MNTPLLLESEADPFMRSNGLAQSCDLGTGLAWL
jgi:hypothetical protein